MIVEGDEELEMISNEMNRFSTTTDEILIRSDEFLKQGLYREGRDDGIIQTAKEMLKRNIDIKTISKCTNLNIDEIKKLNVNNNYVTI